MNKYLQRTASLAYLLDIQMETNLAEQRPSNDIHANANDHSQTPLAQPLRSDQDQNNTSVIAPPPIKGKRSGQDPIPHNAKQARRDKTMLVATELPTSQSTHSSMTHKHTPIARGNREPRHCHDSNPVCQIRYAGTYEYKHQRLHGLPGKRTDERETRKTEVKIIFYFL